MSKESPNLGLNIVLLGMPGSGKSTIGEMVAYGLKMDFVDADGYVVGNKLGGMTVEKFVSGFSSSEQGWKEFRKHEGSAAEEISRRKNTVIATGGGVVLNPENIRYLRETGITILLNAPIKTLAQRADRKKNPNRPLMAGSTNTLSDFEARWDARKEAYHDFADYKVQNAGADPSRTARKIVTAYQNCKLR